MNLRDVAVLPKLHKDQRQLAVRASAWVALVTIFLLALFGLKDFLVLRNDEWPHLYAVVNNPVLNWEETFVYLPLANHFSLETPLPAAPMADSDLSSFTGFPPLTLVLQGALFKWLFLSHIDAYLLAMHTLLPIAAFWVLFLVYRRYVTASWSVLLAFWGVTFFRNFSSLGYWIALLTQDDGFIRLASLSPMEITRAPTPGLTFLLFILTFYFTTRHDRLSQSTMLWFSLLWALHLYVYLFNFIAGTLFWFGYVIYSRYIQDKAFEPGRIVRTLLPNMAIVLAVSAPLLLKQLLFATPLDREIFRRMGVIVATAGPISSDWGFLLAYVLPLTIVIVVAWVSFADYFELLYRFAPIFLMIMVEIVVLNLHLILGQFFQPYLFSVRIGNYFSRFLYFIPIIYFISQPPKARLHHTHRLSHALYPLYQQTAAFVVRWRQVIVLLGIGLIAVVVVSSSLKYADNHAAQVAPHMARVSARLDALAATQPGDDLLVSEDITVNLLTSVLSQRESLLVSSFNNYTPEAEILDRLLLYAHIFNWDLEQFLEFMLPASTYTAFYSDNNFVISPQVLKQGFGYWLLNHRREMSADELAAYETMLSQRFEEYDVQAGARQYGVTAVQAFASINPALAIESATPLGDMMIYQLNTDN